MNPIGRDINIFILKALLRAEGPLTDDTLKGFITSGFGHVAFTAADLEGYVRACEREGWIVGTNDPLLGIVWTLTEPKGVLRAKQLH